MSTFQTRVGLAVSGVCPSCKREDLICRSEDLGKDRLCRWKHTYSCPHCDFEDFFGDGHIKRAALNEYVIERAMEVVMQRT